jgi:hypothetical protein
LTAPPVETCHRPTLTGRSRTNTIVLSPATCQGPRITRSCVATPPDTTTGFMSSLPCWTPAGGDVVGCVVGVPWPLDPAPEVPAPTEYLPTTKNSETSTIPAATSGQRRWVRSAGASPERPVLAVPRLPCDVPARCRAGSCCARHRAANTGTTRFN